MRQRDTDHGRQIYPRRYFDASRTWFAWNKLTTADIYALREEPGFEGQNIYFWLNHPIRFIRVVGIVVQIELVGNGKFVLITLDDSSGANIEIKIIRRPQPLPGSADHPSNTNVDNVNVFVDLGLPVVHLDRRPLVVGTILKAHSCLIRWRHERQLELKKVWRLHGTNEEIEHWSNVAEWKRNVLSKPWVLTRAQRDSIDFQMQQEEALARKAARHRRERQAKHSEREIKKSLARETERLHKEAKFNAGALKGSENLPQPWS